jgi:hypothetical protein
VRRPASQLRQDRRLAVAIFFVALAVYVLTYSGAPKSNDERALFAGIDSFVKRGAFTINQIYWDYTHVGMLTTGGEMVPNYEPAQMVLASPWYVWGRGLAAGVQGVMFFGAFVTAAAVALLYLCLLELGYRRDTAAAAAFLFAFATETWPFARTFFREPLTMLAYLLAFYALLRYAPRPPRNLGWLALASGAVGLAVTNKQTSVAIIPALLVLGAAPTWRGPGAWRDAVAPALAATWRRPGTWRRHLRTAAGAVIREWRQPGAWRERIGPLLAIILPLALILILYRAYYVATLSQVVTFARNVGEYAINPQLSTSKLAQMAYAFTGIAISPYKGLLWYSPILLLGLIGAWPFVRRRPWEGAACVVAILIHVLGYSRYLYWSGGVVWGSRYMLVLVPFLVLLAAPVLAWVLGDPAAKELRDRRMQSEPDVMGPGTATPAPRTAPQTTPWSPARVAGAVAVGLLAALSFAIQILGVALDWQTYELRFLLSEAKVWGGVGEAIQALYMSPAYSPVVGHLRLLLSGTQPLDFAWVQHRPQGAWALVPAGLALALAGVVVATAALIWLWNHPRHTGRLSLVLGLGGIALCSALLLVYRTGDARFDPYDVDRLLRPMDAALGTAVQNGQAPCCRAGMADEQACAGVLVVPDPVLTDYFLNYLGAPLPWYDIEPRPVDTKLLDQLSSRYSDIWLARSQDAASDDKEDRRGTERYLSERAYKLDEQQFDNWARLLHFSAAGQTAETAQPGIMLGDMALDRFTLGLAHRGLPAGCTGAGLQAHGQPSNDGQVLARSGDTLQIGLNWRAQDRPSANYTVFVQLLDANGQVKVQRDRWPGDGLYPTAALTAGQVITDNLALRLDVPPGDYRLIAGLYRNDQPGLPRLTGPGGDFAALAEVRVR